MEYFTAKQQAPARLGSFTVELARSGKEFFIPEGQTILDILPTTASISNPPARTGFAAPASSRSSRDSGALRFHPHRGGAAENKRV